VAVVARWTALAALLALLLACGAPCGAAAEVLALDPAPGAFALDGRAKLAGHRWAHRRAAVAGGDVGSWTATRAGHVYPLRSGQALWFRFTLSEADDNERWYLEIPYPAVDRVTLYTQDPRAAGSSTRPATGWPSPPGRCRTATPCCRCS
jgi:hypothetical protein